MVKARWSRRTLQGGKDQSKLPKRSRTKERNTTFSTLPMMESGMVADMPIGTRTVSLLADGKTRGAYIGPGFLSI